MSYNPNIPQSTDPISQSQSQILTNFSQANTAFGIDHTNLATASNQGFHKQVTYQNVSAVVPATLTTFPQAVSYTRSFGTAPNRAQELYFAVQRETTGALDCLSPSLKAIGKFTTAAAGAQPIISTNTLNLNIASIVLAGSTYTITFTNALDYDTYYVFFTPGNPTAITPRITSQTTAGFSFAGPVSNGIVIGFMVI